MRVFLLSFALAVIIFTVSSAPVMAIDLTKVKIISAEKLNYKDGNSVLIGNVKIQVADYFLSAPKVFIDSDENNEPYRARFIEDVSLESDKISIHSPKMEIDLNNSLLKCFSEKENFVETIINDSDKKAKLTSWYQEFDYANGFAKAQAQSESGFEDSSARIMDKVTFVYDEYTVTSQELELETKDAGIDYVVFLKDAVAIDSKQRTEAQQIYFFPEQNILKAEDQVKIVYSNEGEPAYVFADFVIYEKKKNILSAYSNLNEPRSKLFHKDSYAKARQIVLNLDDKNQADNAILTGMAYSQVADKAIEGHELLFDIKKQNIKTLVGRPKTLLFSKK